MKQQNIKLAVVFGILVIANGLLFVGSGSRSVSFDVDKFQVDSAGVSSVTISSSASRSSLSRSNAGWTLNGEWKADSQFTRILLSVLFRVEVKSKVGPTELARLTERLNSDGLEIAIEGDESSQFFVIGNNTLTKTYFISGDKTEGYEVEIPGYRDYVGHIFQLKPIQWRDRLIFNAGWRTINYFKLDYPENLESSIEAIYGDRFFDIAQQAYDTTAFADYLNYFQFLQVNERITKEDFPRYDSLSETTPQAIFTIKDIAELDTFRLEVFPRLNGENIHLLKDRNGELMVFDVGRMKALLVEKSDFEYIEK